MLKFALLSLVFAAPAVAATIDVTAFSRADYEAALRAMHSVVSEDFEDAAIGNVGNGYATKVGAFSTLGGTGSGNTVRRAGFTNDGSKLALRKGHVHGRFSTTAMLTGLASHQMFLDSNDTYGNRWDVDIGGSFFNRIALSLTDAADTGGTILIDADGTTTLLSGLGNGMSRLVEIEFGIKRSGVSIFFSNSGLNDGFSIDDVAVSQVPLPGSAVLLLGALGCLLGLRRRRP